MTPSPTSQKLPAPVSVDRARLIRQSIRCCVFGAIGVVPIFGAAMAWLALRLHQEVAEETGEPTRIKGARTLAIGAFAVSGALFYFNIPYGAIGVGILLCLWQGFRWYRQYHRVKPVEWNPGRHLVYWGAAMAQTGLVLSSIIIILALDIAFRWDGN